MKPLRRAPRAARRVARSPQWKLDAQARYERSPLGRETARRYRASAKRAEVQRRYRESPLGREAEQRRQDRRGRR